MKYETYYRDLLRPEERRAYDVLVRGLRTAKEKFFVPGNCYHPATRAMQAIQMDLPDLFYLDLTSMRITKHRLMGQCLLRLLDPPRECLRKREAIQQIAQQLMSKISHLRPLDQELAIVDYLATHVTYGFLPGIDEPRSYTLEGALLEGQAVCMGYTRAFNYLCRMAGIPSMMVEGVAAARPAERHSWNLVEIDGHTYHVDVTNSYTQGNFVSRSLVNLSDAQSAKFLQPGGNVPLPTCPNGMNLVPLARGVAELMQMMRQNVQSGKTAFEIAVNHHFKDGKELVDLVERKLVPADYPWYNRLDSFYYNDHDVITIFTK